MCSTIVEIKWFFIWLCNCVGKKFLIMRKITAIIVLSCQDLIRKFYIFLNLVKMKKGLLVACILFWVGVHGLGNLQGEAACRFFCFALYSWLGPCVSY